LFKSGCRRTVNKYFSAMRGAPGSYTKFNSHKGAQGIKANTFIEDMAFSLIFKKKLFF